MQLEDPDDLSEKIKNTRAFFNEENQIQLLQEYSKEHLLLYLISRLNHIGNQFYETRGIPVKELLGRITSRIKPSPERKIQTGQVVEERTHISRSNNLTNTRRTPYCS